MSSPPQVRRHGFTLIELLVVIAIIAILPGAPAGSFRVSVTPPMGPDQSPAPLAASPAVCTVKPQDANTLSIIVEKPRR